MPDVLKEYSRLITFNLEHIPDFYLIETCGACPESYDVYIHNGNKHDFQYIGDLYVRYGGFTISDSSGNTIESHNIKGDGLFEYEERDHMLKLGCSTIFKNLKNTKYEDKDYFDDV